MRNKSLLLVAAALLTAGVANAQTKFLNSNANAKPTAQPGSYTLRGVPFNAQIGETTRSDQRVDNQSYVNQLGTDNWGRVDQNGDKNVANMEQINSSGTLNGNDGYQRQTNDNRATSSGVVGQNSANMVQIGKDNYTDQTQAGNLNLAVTEQKASGNAPVERNYAVQEQTGSNNYGYVLQESSGNFAHQSQTSAITSSIGGGLGALNEANGNYARTLQGGGAGGTNGSNNQWSQTIQNGQDNRALVSQDH